ncbi:hypothetical protein [Streptomyces antimycoticus]|uniref:hypothetical protein n=1 Tax=Streptomyces antimycoticus TaxID=68175 RepID=UPI0036BB8F51
MSAVGLRARRTRVAMVGSPAAERYFGFNGHPTTIVERSTDASVVDVAAVLGRSVNPGHKGTVKVSRPSDTLEAKGIGMLWTRVASMNQHRDLQIALVQMG